MILIGLIWNLSSFFIKVEGSAVVHDRPLTLDYPTVDDLQLITFPTRKVEDSYFALASTPFGDDVTFLFSRIGPVPVEATLRSEVLGNRDGTVFICDYPVWGIEQETDFYIHLSPPTREYGYYVRITEEASWLGIEFIRVNLIVNISRLILPNSQTISTSKSEDLCVICLENYAAGEVVQKMHACTHQFHLTCVRDWIELMRTCPTCRSIVQLRP